MMVGISPPPIEEWWPPLSIQNKHEVLENLDASLSDRVLDEIEELLGRSVPRPGQGLAEHEKNFITTQGELVD